MDNINFTGSFLIKNTGHIGWKTIMRDMIPDASFIKGNFLGRGNMFVATSDRYDREVATYLINSKHNFDYYPDINMKMGITNLPMSMLENMVKGAKALSDKKQIAEHVKLVESRYIPDDYVRKPNDHIKQSLDALSQVEYLPIGTLHWINVKGETLFIDRDGKVVAKASPNNPRGFNFIQVFPRYSTSENMEMIKADYKGSIHYRRSDIDKLRTFKRDYLAALNSVRFDR